MHNELQKLNTCQCADGSFPDPAGRPSVLYTALVLACVARCDEVRQVSDIKKRAAAFLLSQKDPAWKFGADLLADFCALSALAHYDRAIFTPEVLAVIISRLTQMEVQEGGPYRSPNGSVEAPANAAIARFLALFEVELPALRPMQESVDAYFGVPHTEALRVAIVLAGKAVAPMSSRATSSPDSFTADEQRMMDLILKKAEERLAPFDQEFGDLALERIKKTIAGNPDKQMSLIAFYTRQALGEGGRSISDDIVAQMGLVNIFFWTAFIVYDDFWDVDEAADPKLLPIANTFARHYTDFFATLLPAETEFRLFFHKLMDELDAANAWETRHCRTKVEGTTFYLPEKMPDYGEYERKYRPASGHILGPIAMLVHLGYGIHSPEIKNFIAYFRHYLIAMQLNDDAHDWEEDMARGHLSTVVVLLLQDLQESGWTKSTIDLVDDLPKLKEVFWFKTIKRYAKTATLHSELSHKNLRQVTPFGDVSQLERYPAITGNAAKQGLKEQNETEQFLHAFGAM